jgi:hypothetical protein
LAVVKSVLAWAQDAPVAESTALATLDAIISKNVVNKSFIGVRA